MAEKYNKILAYALQRRFGGGEMAATQAIEKGYAGTPYHVRASWMRTRGIPIGTGWYLDREKSGGLVDSPALCRDRVTANKIHPGCALEDRVSPGD